MPQMCREKRGPGRPRNISLALEQESAKAIRKITKSKRRARDDDSPGKSPKKKNKDPESSPCNKKLKAGNDQGGDEGDDDENKDEEEDTEEEDQEEDADVVWLGQKHGKKEESNKCLRKEYEKLLDYDGGHLTEEDVISLSDGKYVTDSILLFFITILRKNKKWAMDRNKIKIVDPSVAHLLKNYRCLDTICNQKTEQKLNEYDWVMYPVNNDAPEGNGGTHWSLLVYRKNGNKFLHFDPIKGMNKKHAIELMLKIQDEEMIGSDGYGPQFVEIQCEKQKNGFDCGPFVMIFLETIIDNIIKGREADDERYVLHKAGELREILRKIIGEEILKKLGKNVIKNTEEKKKDERKTSIQKEKDCKEKSGDKRNDREDSRSNSVIIDCVLNKLSNNLDNTKLKTNKDNRSDDENRDVRTSKDSYNNNEPNNGWSKNNPNIHKADTRKDEMSRQQIKSCYNYFNTICYHGVNCRYDHPRICESWSDKGSCPGVNGGCKKPHPQICTSFISQKDCRRRYCKYLHPRIPKWKNNKAQQAEPVRAHGRNFENNGYRNDGYRSTHHQHRGAPGNPFLHHQGAGPYKRKPYPPHQGKGPFMEGRTYVEREEMNLHRAIIKEILREEMEMMRGVYPEEEAAYRMGGRGSHAGYCV